MGSTMTLVNGTTPGRLSLQLVDATCNKNGFEYGVSDRVLCGLRASKVPLASDDVKHVKTLRELENACQGSFNALLYFAHGGRVDGTEASKIQAGDMVTTWYLLQHLNLNLEDKLVCLCVCHGYNGDAINTLPQGNLFALTVVAPKDAISGQEAVLFFPKFFATLAPLCPNEIDPNIVREKVNELNNLVGNKMKIFSQGLSG